MASAASSPLAMLLGFLCAYPEILLSLASFLFLYHLNHRRGSLVPVSWPIIGMLPSIIRRFHRLHDEIARVLIVQGGTEILRAPGINTLFTCDPDNINHILTTNFDNYPKGEQFCEVFDIFGDAIICADGHSWKAQRKLLNAHIGDRSFRAFVFSATREKAERALLPVLLHKCQAGESADVQDLFTRLTYDVTCRMVFGDDPGSLCVALPDIPFSTAFDDAWEVLLFRHAVPKAVWKMMKWLNVGMERTMAEAREIIDSNVTRFIRKKMEESAENGHRMKTTAAATPVDLLTLYIDVAVENGKLGKFDRRDKFLRDTTVFLMVAGRDAFAITLSWLFWLLSKNPEAEARILEELAAHRSGENKSASFGPDELAKMVYLHGAVCETLRLFPPVPIEEKTAIAADVLPSGARVEAGRKILLFVYAMGRSESIWGEDCMEFKPERWITDEGKPKQVPSYKFMAFNSGPRLCPGREIGLMQVKTVAAAVLWNFEMVVLANPPVVPKNSGMLRMKHGMTAKFRKRSFH